MNRAASTSNSSPRSIALTSCASLIDTFSQLPGNPSLTTTNSISSPPKINILTSPRKLDLYPPQSPSASPRRTTISSLSGSNCGKCLSGYSPELAPRLLSCGHTLCDKCVKKLYDDPIDSVVCYTCGAPTSLPHEGPSSLPINHDLLQLLAGIAALGNITVAPNTLPPLQEYPSTRSSAMATFVPPTLPSCNSLQSYSDMSLVPMEAWQAASRQNYGSPRKRYGSSAGVGVPIPVRAVSTASSMSFNVSPLLAVSRCPSCNVPYSDEVVARILCCFHTYCESCLSKIAQESSIVCPKCQDITTLSTQGVEGLLRNFALQGVKVGGSPQGKLSATELAEYTGTCCPVCLESYVVAPPRLLRCGHSLCSMCLRLLWHGSDGTHIPCPVCRQPTWLGDLGIAPLPINHALASLVREWCQLLKDEDVKWLSRCGSIPVIPHGRIELQEEAKRVFFGNISRSELYKCEEEQEMYVDDSGGTMEEENGMRYSNWWCCTQGRIIVLTMVAGLVCIVCCALLLVMFLKGSK